MLSEGEVVGLILGCSVAEVGEIEGVLLGCDVAEVGEIEGFIVGQSVQNGLTGMVLRSGVPL